MSRCLSQQLFTRNSVQETRMEIEEIEKVLHFCITTNKKKIKPQAK